jgi:hypothetical protein
MKFKYTFFNSNPPVTSDRVRKMLADKDDRKAIVDAFRRIHRGGSGIFKTKKHYTE